jgi:DNA mismatch repair protein MutL
MINKIAAGEVIERPASVVKELVENALDAGATRIDIAIEKGGTELIRIVDNGSGIAPDEMELAIAPHATSKIAGVDDLFRVATLGFRGEALASVVEVSHARITSRTAESPEGCLLQCEGGEVVRRQPSGGPVGTTIEVRNLFFNTPVRKKYLRSIQTELSHVTEAVHRLAIPHPEVHFTFQHNGRTLLELPSGQSMVERIAGIAGRSLAESLLPVESRHGEVVLRGMVAHPSQSRSNNRMQYLFLNGRSIRDRALQHALSEAYRGLMTTGRYPIAFLHLEMPPEAVDVNVHPTKMEVRFLDGGQLYRQLLGAIRDRFLTSDLTARPGASSEKEPAAPWLDAETARDPRSAHHQDRSEAIRQEVVAWAKGKLEEGTGKESGGSESVTRHTGLFGASEKVRPVERRASREEGLSGSSPLRMHSIAPVSGPRKRGPSGEDPNAEFLEAARQVASPEEAAEVSSEPREGISRPTTETAYRGRPVFQSHDRYLVTSTEEGVAIIDQHALHERILYEQLQRRMEAGKIEAQQLLVPEPVDLSPAEIACAMEHRELLLELGVKVDPFGGTTLLVSSYPSIFRKVRPGEILRGLLEPLAEAEAEPDREKLLEALLQTMACKAAIKAGDRLDGEEVLSLLEEAEGVSDIHHCPHGRPSMLVFSCRELDRRFHRT